MLQIDEKDQVSKPKPSEGENHITTSTTSVSQEPAVSPENVGLQSLNSSFASPGPNTTRPSAQVSPYNATPSRPQVSSTIHSVINVDEGTSSRGLDKQTVMGKTCL